MGSKTTGTVAVLLLLVASVVPASAGVYLRIGDTGSFELTNYPSDESFKLIAGSHSREELDEIDRAVEKAAGRHDLPASLILSILKQGNGEGKRVMPLPPELDHLRSDTAARSHYDTIEPAVGHLKELLHRYEGNMTMTLGAYHAGIDRVEEAGGLPDTETRQFVQGVRDSFAEFEDREEIFYTYRNDEGVLTVVNISPS